jgi:hypothetical protein
VPRWERGRRCLWPGESAEQRRGLLLLCLSRPVLVVTVPTVPTVRTVPVVFRRLRDGRAILLPRRRSSRRPPPRFVDAHVEGTSPEARSPSLPTSSSEGYEAAPSGAARAHPVRDNGVRQNALRRCDRALAQGVNRSTA